MTHLEGTEGQHPHEPNRPPIEIGITPDNPEAAVFERTPDGGYTIFLRGEIRLTIHPPAAQAAESPVPATDTPESTKTPEKRSQRLSDAYKGPDKPSWERPKVEGEELPNNEDEKYQLVGNPYRIIGYRVTKKSKTRIADFELATHPDSEDKKHTEVWRLLAFADEADKVRDQMRTGQKGVEVTAYGPKYWERQRKRKGKLETVVIKGFTAGYVHVPKEERQKLAAETPKPQEQQ